MAPLDQLDAYLAGNSYLGSTICATLEDYKQCKEIPVKDVNEKKMPNLHRWHSHISALIAKYPQYDFKGEAIPKGTAPSLGGNDGKQGAQDASPKKGGEAKPKKEAAPKKDAAPKKEVKKEEKKAVEPPKEPTPEELEKMKKDKLKKVLKEGGKRGVEIEGAADMGGLQFFCTAVDLPEGDLDLTVESMKAMNAKSDPTEEERKGGSGHIGKMIFSCGVDQLAVVAYVPEDKVAALSCEEWLKTVLSTFGGSVVSSSSTLCSGAIKTNSDKGIFPLKIREPMILEANNFLRKKGLFPEDNDDDDDECVFGDDDFPSM